jgi:serine/threonine protein kinase
VQEQSHRATGDVGEKQLAGYILEKVLGRGGMGVVYRAHSQQAPDTTFAVKVILTDAAADEKAARRVLREIGIGLELVHERIVRVLAHGSVGNLFYVVMELCDAGSLERLLKRHGGKLPIDKTIRLMGMCLEGMAYAHRRNLVHRDIKPANILLHKGPNGKLHPKISDFGLAKTLELAGLSGMTATGTFGGSWYYMPREQMTNFKFVGPVSDVWSLGATFYQVLTGAYAREFPPQQDPVQVVLQDRPIPIRKRDATIPKKLASIIDRSLADDPAERFADAGAMRQELAELL